MQRLSFRKTLALLSNAKPWIRSFDDQWNRSVKLISNRCVGDTFHARVWLGWEIVC